MIVTRGPMVSCLPQLRGWRRGPWAVPSATFGNLQFRALVVIVWAILGFRPTSHKPLANCGFPLFTSCSPVIIW